MKISPLSPMSAYTAVAFLAAVVTDFSMDAAAAELSPSAAMRSPPSKSKTLLSKLNPRAIYPTAIGRDDAATHPETGESHGIVGQVEQNLASRRLFINQDDAAKRVRDAITAANQAVKNGETSGIALPLDYVKLSDQLGSDQLLTVRLRLPGVDKDQNVQIDTGSSALVFCNKSLIDEAKSISKTNYAQCNPFGSPTVTCPDGTSSGKDSVISGQVFQGDVAVYTDQGEEVASMDNVSFAIAELAQNYACFGPLDGIFGVAYKGQNTVVELPYPDFNVSSLWDVSCVNPDQARFSAGYKTLGKCTHDNMTKVTLPPPLEQSLVQDFNSGQITSEAFGVYLDYAATIGSKVDTVVPSLGIYFVGDLAYDNQFYNNGEVQVAKTVSPNNSGDFYWYLMNFTSIRVPGLNLTQSTVDLCKQYPKCFTDTGNSYIELPLPQDACYRLAKYVSRNDFDELKESGSLFIDLTAADGKDDITLSFPLLWLTEQMGRKNVGCRTTGDFVLGLPITQYYYTVYDMGKNTVSFVELNLSNETEAFIDGPELGGFTAAPDGTTTISPTPQPTSMGCFCHTFGLSLLAWTVLVPTAIAVVTSL